MGALAGLQLAMLPAQSYCTRALALLEAQLRCAGLLALADWEALGIVEPELFAAIGGLQRPSWGSWSYLLQSLRNARKAQLRAGRPDVRARLEGASVLHAVLSHLDANAPADMLAAARVLADYLDAKQRLRRVADVLVLPISLRNRLAHFPPADEAGWELARSALVPLVAWHAEHPWQLLDEAPAAPEPWFVVEDQACWVFNGVERELVPLYASALGAGPRAFPAQSGKLLHALQRLLGRSAQQDAGFHRLLARLAPEEIRGVVLGDFLVGPPVARGGFATVHAARQLSTGRKVAMKLLHDGLGDDARARFQQEAEFLSRMSHPSVVGVISYGDDVWSVPRFVDLKEEAWFQELSRGAAVRTYIALEWIDGRTLEDVFQRAFVAREEAPPAVDVLRRWFREAASALAAVHGAGLIHRDVKPANLMVDGDGRIRLMDFGIARSADENRTLMTSTGYAVGTPPYMAPEQIRARDSDAAVGPASDVYALCASFYELATGSRLFAHDRDDPDTVRTRKLRGELPARPRALANQLPWELETILLGGLQAEAADRYPSTAALVRDLDHWDRAEPIEYRRPGWLRRAALTYRRNRTITNLLAGFAAILLIATGVYWRSVQAARDRARSEQGRAEEQHARLTEKQQLLVLGQARQLVATDPTRAVAMIEPLATTSWWRQVRAIGAAARAHGVAFGLPASPHTLALEVGSTGALAVAAGDDGAIRLYDLARRTERVALTVSDRPSQVNLADHDRTLVVAHGRALTVVDVASGAHHDLVAGASIASFAVAGTTAYWVDAEHEAWSAPLAGGPPTRVALDEPAASLSASPDGRWLVLAGDADLLVIDRTRPDRAPDAVAAGTTHAVAWAADSSHLVALIGDDMIALEMSPDLTIVRRQRVGACWSIAYAGDQAYVARPTGVAAVTLDGARKLEGDFELELRVARGDTIVAASKTGAIAIMSELGDRILPGPERIDHVAASSAGPWVVAAAAHELLVWNLDTLQPRLVGPPDAAGAAFAGGDQLIVAGIDGAHWLEIATGTTAPLPFLEDMVAVVPAPDAKAAVVIEATHHAMLVARGAPTVDLGDARHAAYAGAELVMAREDGELVLRDPGGKMTTLAQQPAGAIALAANASWIAAAFPDGTLWRCAASGGAPAILRAVAAPPGGAFALADDGTVLFGTDANLHAWRTDGTTAMVVALPVGPRGATTIARVALVEASRALAIGANASAALFGLGSSHEVRVLAHAIPPRASLARDGSLAAAIMPDGALQLVDPVADEAWNLVDPGGDVLSNAELAPDGRFVLVTEMRGVLAWRLDLPRDAAATARWLHAMTNAVDHGTTAPLGW